jgi:hypothetical protein
MLEHEQKNPVQGHKHHPDLVQGLRKKKPKETGHDFAT